MNDYSHLIPLLISIPLACVMVTDTASSTVISMFNSAVDVVKTGGSIVTFLAIVVGLLVCFAGYYRYFRHALFVCGVVGGGVLVATIVEHAFKDKSWMIMVSWIGFALGQFISGVILASLYKFGIFIIVVASDLALKLEKPVFIVSTSLFGAGILMWGVSYFTGNYPNADDLKRYRSQSSHGNDIPSAWWVYLAGMVVLFILSMLAQLNRTGLDAQYHKSHSVPTTQYVETTMPQSN